ncbi:MULTISPECIES: lytic murein transglycosylase [unclassified Achromobacter]|uniref:lytic murein transglycosylase n=1 Tax=unclassified Achromobacter TaxID=2626865 RepID=UPI000B517C81|nr:MULTISPECIES: lytic murein transglycosylase [unclassified Achromobacter]OWT76805.1 type III effector [Achromobacter sp. HZ28]OWT77685.1 type III effector [Achromobacter sp. HZ34]
MPAATPTSRHPFSSRWSRLSMLAGLSAAMVTSYPVLAQTNAPAPAVAPTVQAPAQQDQDPAACLAKLRVNAPANGISVADFDRYTQGSKLLAVTVAAAKAQPESKEYWWDYIAKTVDDQRVAEGQAVLRQYAAQLNTIDQTYQIDSEPLAAIFGIETNYGTQFGKVDVLNAWLTRACTENKPLWIKNVYASTRLLRDGVVQRDNFIGSWSGAFGMTQFIPTSFYELAADGDGDGRIDLYNSLPDALASTANHLLKRKAKWTRGLPPVIEVKLPGAIAATLPQTPDAEIMNQDDKRNLAQWSTAGVTLADGKPLSSLRSGPPWASVSAYVFAPTGARGPVFLATNNFDAILHYNQARKYALAVSLLTNRLKGDGPLVTPWPTDDPGLSRAQIKQLQQLLATRGYDVGTPDGIPGSKTREAVSAEQARLGLPQDGRPGGRMLKALQTQ